MRDPFDRMLVVFGSAFHRSSEAYWRPAADIYRTRTGWLIKYDLAGVRPEGRRDHAWTFGNYYQRCAPGLATGRRVQPLFHGDFL